jgi:hypothetical protein
MAHLKLSNKGQNRSNYYVCCVFVVFIVFCNAEQPTDEKAVAALHEMLNVLQKSSDESANTNSAVGDNQQGVPPTSMPAPTVVQAPIVEHKKEHVQQPGLVSPQLSQQDSTQAAVPQPQTVTEQEIKSIEEEKVDERVGIDTVNLTEPQGNWLYKSIWYQRAQDRYEQIRAFVDQIWELRTTFFSKRAELDRTVLDPFYISIGLGLGELQEILTDLVGKFDLERKKDGDLNIQERSLLQEVKDEQLLIEKLNITVKTVADLDHMIDDALNKLMEQLNKVRMYEKDAWNNFKKISQLLSDTKARELYYAMDIQMRNIKDVQKYLQNDFAVYFNSTVERMSAEIKTIKSSIEKLKEQGVDFKMQTDVLFASLNNEEKKHEVHEQNDVHEQDQQVEKQAGLIQRSFNKVKDILYLFIWPFSVLYKSVFG